MARRVIQLPIEPGLICLKGLSPTRLRFEVEYGLERGTTANSFLFQEVPLLVHPPGASFAEPFLAELAKLVQAEAPLKVVVGHVNPNRVALLRQLAARWPNLLLVSSNAGAKLLEELWNLQKPLAPGSEKTPEPIPALPRIDVVKQEASRNLVDGHVLRLIPTPTPRWPGALLAFEETSGLLMSGKFFAAPPLQREFRRGQPQQ